MAIDVTVQDGDGSIDVGVSGGATSLATINSGTVTATGGASPAVDTTLDNVTDQQTYPLFVFVSVDSDPSWNADYAFNYDWGPAWDDANSHLDMNLTVNWDTDPGSGNDLTLSWQVVRL